MNIQDTAKRLWDLFVNRTDVYGLETETGWVTVKKPLKIDHIVKHLKGEITLGVHTISELQTSKWICIEADRFPSMAIETAVKRVFKKRYAKFFTGGKSYHVFVFFKPEIPSHKAHYFAKSIAKGTGLKFDFFPRQPYARIGNFIRLPLGLHRKTGKFGTLEYPKSLDEIQTVKLIYPWKEFSWEYVQKNCPHRVKVIGVENQYACMYDDSSIGECKFENCYLLT